MSRTRGRDNPQEKALRSALFREGLRFRVHYRVPGVARRSIDVAFVGSHLAVFLDGCFWHGCPRHATWPARNAGFWRQKIEANRKRDSETDALLEAAGWRVIRIWEHEDTDAAAARIRNVVKGMR
ncbi:very short patch repair endonuclease [Bradyrhizobium diazoefficiens]|uniref:XorII very-short-patch-repair endonuclease n=1 Tax=Bradyrhizobium diazoefficiens TaxID=1355477 RepID=A0A810BG34_9BRAD|nr:XorII very-short-patch-repair endonuclease [Bradyrhizobium diazoefficiens]